MYAVCFRAHGTAGGDGRARGKEARVLVWNKDTTQKCSDFWMIRRFLRKKAAEPDDTYCA